MERKKIPKATCHKGCQAGQFIDHAPHNIAVRVYQGEYQVQKAKTIAGKKFILLNLPFYLLHRIERELNKLM